MDDPSPYSDSEKTGVGPDRVPPGMPLWVKVSLIVVIALVVAFLFSLIAGVQHGPRLH